MTELCDLARKWGTDKALYYTPLYHELMGARRESVTKVLEFGIGYPSLMMDAVKRIGREDYVTGASLFMWRDYFPNAQIMALDCNPSALVNEERIRSLWCDQSMASTYPMDEIGWDFDLIVEDGSHFQPDQILCAQQLVPLLKQDGVYVMEDVTPMDGLFIELVRDSVVGDCTVHDFGEGTGDPARVIVIRKVNPYLSVVMGIGGTVSPDLIARLQASTANTFRLACIYEIPLEIVVVEWNFPEGLKIPRHFDIPANCSLRCIHVPRELHARMPNPHRFNYFEWYPKNIGIRRAQGEFVLSTNPDDLWSEPLAQFFATRTLQSGHFYRINRYDTRNGMVFQISWPTGTFPVGTSEQLIRATKRPGAAPWSPNMIHYNASGDFTLMSREDWFRIHGNPERPYNNSVDGQTLYLAHMKGIKQIVLPFPLYHPDHKRTLNFVDGQPRYAPWDDNHPFTKENGEDWGFAGQEFPETVL